MMGPQMTQISADFYGLKDEAQTGCDVILLGCINPARSGRTKQNHLRKSADDPAFPL